MKDIRRKFLLAIGICLIITVVCIPEIKAEEGPSAADQDSPKRIKLETEKEPHLVIIEKTSAPKKELQLKEITPAPFLGRVEFKEITPPAPIQSGKEIETKEGKIITKPSIYQIGPAKKVAPGEKPIEGKQTRENQPEQGEKFNFSAQQKQPVPIAPPSEKWKIKAKVGEAQSLTPVDAGKTSPSIEVKVREVKLITSGEAEGKATEEIIVPPTTLTTPKEGTTIRKRTTRPRERSDK